VREEISTPEALAGRVSDEDTMNLRLELHRHEEPITGRLHKPDGTRTPFVGWLEFTRVLETARQGDTDSGGPPEQQRQAAGD
jgi:hypothetical protein